MSRNDILKAIRDFLNPIQGELILVTDEGETKIGAMGRRIGNNLYQVMTPFFTGRAENYDARKEKMGVFFQEHVIARESKQKKKII